MTPVLKVLITKKLCLLFEESLNLTKLIVYLKRQLEDYVKQFEVPVRILRLGKRLGLIQARLLGTENAKGQVFTFLDSHCECNEGWLQPLLDRIAGDRYYHISITKYN